MSCEVNGFYDGLNDYEQLAFDYYQDHDFFDNLILLEEVIRVHKLEDEAELEALFIDNLNVIGEFLVDDMEV